MRLFTFIVLINKVLGYDTDRIGLAVDYFVHKNVKFLCYFTCYGPYSNKIMVHNFLEAKIRVSVQIFDEEQIVDVQRILHQWSVDVGVLVEGECIGSKKILDKASSLKLFDATHVWLVFAINTDFIEASFDDVNLSIDADIAAVTGTGGRYELRDVYNFGTIQGNPLERTPLGTWRHDKGLVMFTKGFKYYERWNFHNLTLRAVSVILEPPEVFYPELLSDIKYTQGVAAMTKITSQLLNILKEEHNFRFNYTIASRWIGSPERNSTLAVSNSLYWGEQDISSTTARIFPHWLDWVDIYFPPVTNLETKFYYLIPDKGVGEYDNQFLTPMSSGVWWCSLGTGVVCAFVLAAAALMEGRPDPSFYAFFSVFATSCQQGRRGTLLVVGLTSMLLYNYYTSSVVSWLLNAAAPSIANMDVLINSDLELIFEDIGYTRGWLDNPGFFYYSGFVNAKEDELREKKVTAAKRNLKPLQPVETGIELIRTGRYAYHTEPFTASQVISRRFEEQELCELGALPMMLPAHVYIYGQKRSPYKQFFVWSLMRLLERGHMRASQARFAGTIPSCSGRMPRALALGQAAPAFILLVEAALLSTLILLFERMWYRYRNKKRSLPRPREVGAAKK